MFLPIIINKSDKLCERALELLLGVIDIISNKDIDLGASSYGLPNEKI